MKKLKFISGLGIALIFSLAACKKEYNPPEIQVVTNFLVVDGTISCGTNAITTITLSRTKRLTDSILFHPELNASVYIDAEAGGSFLLDAKGDGIYQSQALNLPAGRNYRLRITVNGREYLSDYSMAKVTPQIDSLTWRQDGDAIVLVHTHDPSGNTRYYRWDYTETWTYGVNYHTNWGVKDGMSFVKDSLTQTDSCWRTANSTTIVVGSSVALSSDVMSYYPVARVTQSTEKISRRYSILVRQYAINDEAYRYLQLIRKNTEQLGTLFDGQPSQLEGNIHATDNPAEPVIGFITASTVTEKRLFIAHTQVQDWNYLAAGGKCTLDEMLRIPVNPVDYRIWTYPDPDYTIYQYTTGGPVIIGRKTCLECTALGGSNVKPSYW
jgi:hypothetical protein